MRYPIRYTKPITLRQLKVGDKIEPAWAWENDMVVTQVLKNGVVFDNGKVLLFEDFPAYSDKFRLIKIRMSKTPEHFNQP